MHGHKMLRVLSNINMCCTSSWPLSLSFSSTLWAIPMLGLGRSSFQVETLEMVPLVWAVFIVTPNHSFLAIIRLPAVAVQGISIWRGRASWSWGGILSRRATRGPDAVMSWLVLGVGSDSALWTGLVVRDTLTEDGGMDGMLGSALGVGWDSWMRCVMSSGRTPFLYTLFTWSMCLPRKPSSLSTRTTAMPWNVHTTKSQYCLSHIASWHCTCV